MRIASAGINVFDEDGLAEILEAREDWEDEILYPVLDTYGEWKGRFATVSNMEVDRVYARDDISNIDYAMYVALADRRGVPANRSRERCRTTC